MQKQHNKRSQQFQEMLFDRRFFGASLAKVSLPGGSAESVAEWIKKPKGFLVMTGEPGTGKTYFCAAMVDAMCDRVQHLRYFDERDLLRRIRQGLSESSTGDYLGHLQDLLDNQLVILDDIGSSGHNEWREEVLMEAIDLRYRKMLPTIITSNLSRKEFFETYGKRITSRLFAKENTIIDLNGMPDLRQEGK